MLKLGMFLKHDRFMDVAIFLNKHPIKLTDGRYIVRGEFWNMGFEHSWPLNIKFSHILTKEDIRENYTVTKLTPSSPDCLRKCKWIKI